VQGFSTLTHDLGHRLRQAHQLPGKTVPATVPYGPWLVRLYTGLKIDWILLQEVVIPSAKSERNI
jgi:hypothetical protein